MGFISQKANTELISILSAIFAKLNDPARAWARAINGMQMLPGLRGLWPMSGINSTPEWIDLSGFYKILSVGAGTPASGVSGLRPYVSLDGTAYLSRADEADLDITGTETYIEAAYRGITVGGWFLVNNAGLGAARGLMSKWSNTQFSWRLNTTVNNYVEFATYDTSTVTDSISSSTTAITADTWFFACGRLDPGTSIDVWLNGTKYSDLTLSDGTDVNVSTADLNIGRYANANVLIGDVSLCFLCASALPDTVVNSIYWQTKALYGL